MSLSVCTQKVRITSPNGTFLSEGETRCTDIATLRNLGYTIEELEEPTQPDFTSVEEVVEPTPVEEPVVIQEPETIVNIPVENIEEIQVVDDIFVMQADLLINRSLELATTNVNLEAENQTLRNTIQGLQTDVSQMPFANEKEYHEFLLSKHVEKVHAIISSNKGKTTIHPKSDVRKQQVQNWVNSTEQAEISLEEFARNLGLNYTRRSIVDGENIYYNAYERSLDPIYRDDWVSYIPTSSATVGSQFN